MDRNESGRYERMKVYYEASAAVGVAAARLGVRVRESLKSFAREEKGDLVSSLGWMAIMALALVIIKGLVDGKLVGYVSTVFTHLDRLFNA